MRYWDFKKGMFLIAVFALGCALCNAETYIGWLNLFFRAVGVGFFAFFFYCACGWIRSGEIFEDEDEAKRRDKEDDEWYF